jgi:DNA mismatch repair protein MutL
MGSRSPTREKASRNGAVRLLPSELVDQIAAGEVVERPASVLKELVENSLDAGARRIRVEIRDGGSSLIAVTDDGPGMEPEEARMALRRHATSKIATLDDLGGIVSFGFRGEALPAIASVSRMRLLTRLAGRPAGHEIRIESSKIVMEREAGCPEGTRIEVADLFGRVPARRKFLKKSGTEWGHAIDWLGRLAMALPSTHFEVQRDDREAVVWPETSDTGERIAAVLGEGQARSLVRIEWEEGAGHVEAYVSGPEASRANGNSIHLYVNGRPVRDKLLRHAVSQAYRDILPRGRFPLAVLFLTVAPEAVDVNVHPAKWEVRFENPRAVHQLVGHAIREAMGARGFLSEPPLSGGRRDSPRSGRVPSAPGPSGTGTAGDPTGKGDWLFAGDNGAGDRVAEGTDKKWATGEGASPGSGSRIEFSKMRLLGQLKARYLVLEGEQGLVLVDQHAAHERILYEHLRGAWLDRKVERQGLLVPETLEIDSRGAVVLGESSELIDSLGFDAELFGESSVLIRAIPALLSGTNPRRLVGDLLDELGQVDVIPEAGASRTRMLPDADRLFATLACHSARRFGDHLPEAEQRAILKGLDAIAWAPTCPHGRPVAAHLGLTELDGRFGRH